MTLVWKSGLNLQSPTANDPLLDLNTQPSLDLQFATSKTLDDRVSGTNLITFTRASSGTYVDSDGLIKTAVTDEARFDHDPVTGESLGLLIEEARTNSITPSVPQDTSPWSPRADTTCTLNAATAPDGTLTATKVSADVGNTSYAWDRYTLGTAITGPSVVSVYAKDSGEGGCAIAVNNTSGLSIYQFNFTTKNGVLVGAGDGRNPQNLELPNGWFRLSFSIGPGFTRITLNARSEWSATNNPTGNGVNGVLFWGAQLEEGSFPTSYIPTSGSTVTRAADVASITGTNFSSWYNQSEGTAYITYQNRNVSTIFSAAKFNDGTGLNIITPVNNSNNAAIVTAGVIVFSETTSANVYLQTLKRALAFEENNTRLAVDGTLVGAVDTSVTIPVVNKVDIGTGTAGAIARLAYYPYRLADATLQEITS